MKDLLSKIEQRTAVDERKIKQPKGRWKYTYTPNNQYIPKRAHAISSDELSTEEDHSESLEGKLVPKRVHWEILPPGEYPFERINQYINHLKRTKWKNREIDSNRIRFLNTLSPDEIYFGLSEFDGYLVFNFYSKKCAVLDCPLVGNAIYVVRGDWKKVSKLTKKELLEKYTNIKRVIHKGNWKDRLMKLL